MKSSSRGVLTRSTWGLPLYYLFTLLLFAGLSLILGGCGHAQWTGSTEAVRQSLRLSAQSNEIVVASYNVENLFDAVHEKGRRDFTYLPMDFVFSDGKTKLDRCEEISSKYYKLRCKETNWTPDHVNLKLRQIKRAIGAIGERPDLLGLQEIENESVTKPLAALLGYGEDYILTKGENERGIDVALLYRTEKLGLVRGTAKELVVPSNQLSKVTRNILRVVFFPREGNPNHRFIVYVNHWPSPGNPKEDRTATAKTLRRDIDRQIAKYGVHNTFAIVLGDFNTISWESPNALHNVVQDPNWQHSLVDAQSFSYSKAPELHLKMPSNSYFYYKEAKWERLDHILLSQNLTDGEGVELRYNSFRIVAEPFMMSSYTVSDPDSFYYGATFFPVTKGYNALTLDPSKAGFSDHLPIAAKIKIK